jgi:predicted ATPase/DNA-binding SARP family transcriptional activator
VEFRILGPLEVVDGGSAVPVGGPKPRALLAALLLRPGAVVSTDRLVTAVWGAAPPRDAIGALRAYVSRLRVALPGERLRWRAPGYVLDVAGDELDAATFGRLLGLARERAAVAAHAQAVDLFDAALALWRGDALIEFDAPDIDLDGHLARLADLRLAATQERAEAMLALGRGREIVAEMEGLVERHPEREALAALLMRALYASGRQADALAVYRALRRRLVDELGVEPSDATREVHRRMLEQDPALTPAAEAPAGNLPRRGAALVGRESAVAHVAHALRTAPLVSLTGVGGVGKTRLAVEVATRERPRFADGAWLCELAPLGDGGSVAHAVAAALRVQERHGATIGQTVVEYLAHRSLLLVLDNCEHVLDAAAGLAAGIVAHCPGVVVLATSREPLGVAGEQIWPVPPLPLPDATTLFVQRARATRPDFDPGREHAGAVAEICLRVDGLPLGIELAAARTRAMSAAEIASRLDDVNLLTHGPRTAQPRHQSLAAAIEWSYRLLEKPEQQLFARMSVFAGGADLAAVHAVCAEPGTTEIASLDLVAALVDKSMVEVVGGAEQGGATRYRVLETLRAYGRDRLFAIEPVARRHAEHFTALAEVAARAVQGVDEKAWVAATLPDADNLRAALEFAYAERDVDLGLRLTVALPEVLQVRRGFETTALTEHILGLADPDHPLFAATVGAVARGAWCVGDFARADRLAARAAGAVLGPGTARSGHPADVAADVALYRGDVGVAETHYAEQVVRARRDGDRIRLVWALYYVAICHAVRRVPERGVAAARESLEVATATGNPTALSMARYALGLVLKKADPDRALDLLDEAARLGASVHNFWWEGIALMEAAATRAVHGDGVEAAGALVAVLDVWDRVGDWTQQWLNLRYVVRLLVRLGAEQDAAVLHHCLLAAGKPSSLDPQRAARLLDGPEGPRFTAAARSGAEMGSAAAVTLARDSLSRFAVS